MAIRLGARLGFMVMRKTVRTRIPRGSVCHEEYVIHGWVEDREPYLRLSLDLSVSTTLTTRAGESDPPRVLTRGRETA